MIVRFATEDKSLILQDNGAGTLRWFEVGSPEYAALLPQALPYVPPPAPTPEEIQAQMRAARAAAYAAEADPLFFKWQAGESAQADWLAKRAEIRARYPYPDEAQ
jgi:hypothetical protein